MSNKEDKTWLRTFFSLLQDSSESALVFEDQSYTRYELFAKVKFYYLFLKSQGVKKNDTLSLLMLNSIDWIAIFFAALLSGVHLNLVNTRYKKNELSYSFQKSQSQFVFTEFRNVLPLLDHVVETKAAVDKVFYIGHDEYKQSLPAHFVAVDETMIRTDIAALFNVDYLLSQQLQSHVYFSTSGSTSGPKLVMHSAQTLMQHAFDCAEAYGLYAEDVRVLLQLPLSGVFGLNTFLMAYVAEAPLYLESLFDEQRAVFLIKNHHITHTVGSDEMIKRIQSCSQPFELQSLRFFGFGAFTSNFDMEAMAAIQHGIPLHGLYGSSEVQAIMARQLDHLPIEQRIQGGGMPVAKHAKVRIVDLETATPLPVGQVGEIEIFSDSLFLGYFNDESATQEAFSADGFFKTGDVGYSRADGSFVYLSRKGEVIRLGGYLVNPTEVELDIKALPQIQDAQVIAMNESNNAAYLVAFVIMNSDGKSSTELALQQQLKQHIAGYKIPRFIYFVEQYPQINSPNGTKVDRKKLRDIASQHQLAVH